MKKHLYLLLVLGIIAGLLPLNACSKDTPETTKPAATTTTTVATTTTPPQTTTPPSSTSVDLETKAIVWVDLLVKGEYEQAVESFDATMSAQVSVPALENIWKSLLTQIGEFVSTKGTRTVKDDKYEAVFVTCEFNNALIDVQVTFDAEGKIAGLFFHPASRADEYIPPAYADSSLFTENEVTVGRLPGTLTIPVGEGSFPAVVLVHGSGANDRDETLEMNKPFKDLAWGLASRVIAVLRYDKRTLRYPQEFEAVLDTFTVKEEVIDDAVAAVGLLYETEGVDTDKIFVLGHSLGGMLAPRIAAADSNIAGLIVLAGPTRPLEDLFTEQYTYIFLLDGQVGADEQAQLDAVEEQVQKVKTLDISPGEAVLGAGKAYWQDLAGYYPPALAAELAVPMLVLQGERDYQVTMEDFQGWVDALEERQDVTLKSYPDLNHLFFTGSGKSIPAEYKQPGNVAEEAVKGIAAWIKGR